MADAVSAAACIERHREYSCDISTRLIELNVVRLTEMFAPVRDGESVLDVGCNSGYAVDFLPASCVCHGVDVAVALVEKARPRLASVAVAPAEALPFPDKSLDVVALGEILEHVFDPVAVLREAGRVARRLVIGSTPHELSQWGPSGKRAPKTHKYHVRCFTRTTLASVLGQAGFAGYEVAVTTVQGRPMFYRFSAQVSA